MSSTENSPSSEIKDFPVSECCPVCMAPVEKAIAFICDGCGRSVHFSCLGLLSQDKSTCERLRRYSSQVKFLCADCNGVFRVPMYNYFIDSPNSVASNVTTILQNPEMQSIIRNVIALENEKTLLEVTKLRREMEELKQSNIELVRLLTDNPSKAAVIHGSSAAIPVAIADTIKPTDTYANKLSSATQAKVMIKPKVAQKAFQTQEDLLRNVDLLNENISVTNSKKAKDGAIIVGCNNIENSKKLKQLAADKLSNDYDVFVLRSEHPRVRIVGIPSCLNKESFMSYLKSQNSDLLADATEYRLLNFWPLKKNKKILQATVQLDIHTYKKVMKAGGLLVGINICKLYDDTTVTRCFKCNGFNHTKTKCPRPVICPLCAGEHQVNTCHSVAKVCINCRSLKHMHGFDISVDHPAWDYKSCFAFKFAEAKLRNVVFGEPVRIDIRKIPNFKPTDVQSVPSTSSGLQSQSPGNVNVTPSVQVFNRFEPLSDFKSNFLDRP